MVVGSRFFDFDSVYFFNFGICVSLDTFISARKFRLGETFTVRCIMKPQFILIPNSLLESPVAGEHGAIGEEFRV